jgi:hypothetical protein
MCPQKPVTEVLILSQTKDAIFEATDTYLLHGVTSHETAFLYHIPLAPILMWRHVDAFLGNDREISNYTTAVTK